ncbi:hypothetical protein HK097_000544 [Rhizophlyctis rosea]|uniref:Ubiquitin-conjugating enzyme E2 Z n=1 Tax=Rhizophlyctis rosea TaxID=64517 RepID=A0AAD5SLF3_9FUNG|nr:hypothetical protein HK097_000544 [Rhizophlyctis rosea]
MPSCFNGEVDKVSATFRELLDIQRNPDHQLYLWYDENNFKHVHALITGPASTPYCLGLFDFVFNFGDDYPSGPPKVTALTTSNGRVRFNPNIYANGKVCLSILGTWRGEAGEQWSSAHGILSVAMSIQSLMSDKPYLNEPGFEDTKDEKIMETYNQKIRHETIRISICDRLERYLGWKDSDIRLDGNVVIQRNFCTCREDSPFEDLAKRMMLLYYETYSVSKLDQEVIATESAKVKDGTAFTKTQFEGGSNSMDGSFQYAKLKDRLDKIHTELMKESDEWIKQSRKWVTDETTTSSNLKSQFDQIQASKEFDDTVFLELEDGNPFIWIATIIGMPASQYDGGMFRVKLVFHDKFPDIYPRVRFISEVFHPQITKDGVPYYRVKRPEDVKHHLEALLRMFKEDPSSDPTTHVNAKAATLYFGTKEERRDYNRNARRCAQRSVEY